MALFTFVCEECQKEAEHHGLITALDRFVKRVEVSQDTRYFDPFPPPYLVKKQFGIYQGRLIASRHTVKHQGEDHTVIVFLSIMIRGEHAYDAEFGRDPENYGNRFFSSRYSQKVLDQHVATRMKVDPVKPKPQPSESEYGYLYQALQPHGEDGDDFICESAEWVQQTQKEPFKDALTRLYDAITKIVPETFTRDKLLPVPNKPGWGILARHYPELKLWFLISPFDRENTEKEKQLREQYKVFLGDVPTESASILQRCRRAYPGIVLADESLWTKVQQDPLGNLALSPEETGILESTLKPNAFPLFINGRAGSGKSTILQYLFTDYVYYHLTQGYDTPCPVYFACNGELLRQARSVVESLLKCGAKYWKCENREEVLEQAQVVLDSAFKEFRSHLLSLLPKDPLSVEFNLANRVDYARFRRMWLKKFSKEKSMVRDCSPDLCWHVIRTYIKGASAEAILDPDEYLQMDQKQRSVSQKTYEKIYTHVWERWYKSEAEQGYLWDDQDLARKLLDAELIKPIYPGIFCDEAQDFTRIELEVILRMSLFSDRSVAPNEIARIPFVFAGDQFQTINPTGFRWDSVKAWFVEKFIFTLDPARRSGLNDLNYKELSFNYRSSPQIVGFSNYVQALRSRLFDIPGLQPQTAWDDTPASPVVFYRPDDPVFWEGIKKLGDAVFVLPCHENEELEFVRNHPSLAANIPVRDGIPAYTTLSAARAKGQEYPRVVVFGFGGEYCPANLLSIVGDRSDQDLDQETMLPMEYFVNRLYVSVSRPKRQLFIVDDESGIQNLWEFALNLEWEKLILDGIKKGHDTWGNKLTMLQPGGPSHLNTSEPIDPLANAQQLERDARGRGDSYMMKSASVAYKNAGKDQLATLCWAEAMYLEDDFLGAGAQFLDGGDAAKAVSCFWTAGKEGWSKLLSVADVNSSITGRLEYALAEAILKSNTAKAYLKVIRRLAEQFKSSSDDILSARLSYSVAVEAILTALLASKEEFDWKALHADMGSIAASGLSIRAEYLARIAYNAKDFIAACKHYESAGLTGATEYRRAKVEIAPYPERIHALAGLEEWSRVASDYLSQKEVRVDQDAAGIVVTALLKVGLLEQAIPLLEQSRKVDAYLRAYQSAAASNNTSVAVLLYGCAGVLAVIDEHWADLSAMIKNRTAMTSDAAVIIGRALGRSPTLSKFPPKGSSIGISQGALWDFMRAHFIDPPNLLLDQDAVIEIGAAIERGQHRGDAVRFYKKFASTNYPGETARQIASRMVICMERQSKYDSNKGDERVASKAQEEIARLKSKLGLPTDVKLPEYPELTSPENYWHDLTLRLLAEFNKPNALTQQQEYVAVEEPAPVKQSEPITVVPEKADKLEAIVEGFRFAFFKDRRRINIEQESTGNVLHVKDAGADISGDFELIEQDSTGYRAIYGTELAIRIEVSKLKNTITIKFNGKQAMLVFEV